MVYINNKQKKVKTISYLNNIHFINIDFILINIIINKYEK